MTADQVSHEEFKGRCDLCDERFARDNKRLNKLEDAFEVTSKLDVKFGLIIEQLQQQDEQQDQRISTLEQKPAKRWDSLVLALLASLASGIIGMIIGLAQKGVGI